MCRKLLEISSEKNIIAKKLRFLAWLNKQLRLKNTEFFPILVGGGAVEYYTGKILDKDIDIVYSDTEILNEILFANGFSKDGRYWFNDEIDIVLECPGSERPENVTTIIVDDEEVYISSIEEMIVDRLCAYKFWGSKEDGEMAQIMLGGKPPINEEILKKRAIEEDVIDIIPLLI